jgi:hypothetical protein
VTDSFLGADAFAEFRAVPANELQTVHLGHLPTLDSQLQVSFSDIYWLPDSGLVTLNLKVKNHGSATVRLEPTFFALQGGDAQQTIQIQPTLPVLLNGQEAQFLTLSFLAPDGQPDPDRLLIFKAGGKRWQIPFASTLSH